VTITINTPEEVQTDLNSDGYVNDKDLLTILLRWGPSGTQGYPPSKADMNNDGEVDYRDLFEFQMHWRMEK
jgi:hypothetical protein